MFCRKCGYKLVDDAMFCPKCGTKVVFEENGNEFHETGETVSPKKTGRTGTLDNFRKKPVRTNYTPDLDSFKKTDEVISPAAEVIQDEPVSIAATEVHTSENNDAQKEAQADAVEAPATPPEEKKPLNNKKKGIIIGAAALVVLIIVALIAIPSIMKSKDYDEAMALIDKGKYEQAEAIFKDLSEKQYKNSAAKVIFCENMIAYNKAQTLLDEKKYYDAYLGFTELAVKNFRDSQAKATGCIQPLPTQGQLYRDSSFASDVSMTITLDSGMGDRYIKIYDATDKVILTAYIKSGGSTTVKLPATTIKMKTAAGTNWFGETDMYGKDGVYQTQLLGESAETTTLKNNYTYTLKLGGVTNGNVPSKSVGADEM